MVTGSPAPHDLSCDGCVTCLPETDFWRIPRRIARERAAAQCVSVIAVRETKEEK